jgi:hypothetical protein
MRKIKYDETHTLTSQLHEFAIKADLFSRVFSISFHEITNSYFKLEH